MNGSCSACPVRPTVTRFSSIASSSADWVFGVARLISSASRSCVNTGPCWNWKWRRPASSCEHDLRADDVRGHEVGGELDAGELQVQRIGKGLHQQRLAQPRHAFQQRVAGGEQAGEYAVHQVVVTDDAPLDLAPQRIEPLACEQEALLVVHGTLRVPGDCSRDGRSPWLRFRKYRRMNSLWRSG